MKPKVEDSSGRKRGSAWPLEMMLAAAKAVVEDELVPKRVADEFGIPYTTLLAWVKKYRAGGRAALEQAPGRGGKTSGYPQAARVRSLRTEARGPVGNAKLQSPIHGARR